MDQEYKFFLILVGIFAVVAIAMVWLAVYGIQP